MATNVAGVIEPALQVAETARLAKRPTDDLTAYDLYLRAHAMFFTSARQIPEALRLLEQAIERDPGYGPALAWAARCCLRLCMDGRSHDLEAAAKALTSPGGRCRWRATIRAFSSTLRWRWRISARTSAR